MVEARLHDASMIAVEVRGRGPTVLLPVNPSRSRDHRSRRCAPVGIRRRAELEALGWQVRVLDGLDHIKAMQAVQVLPILRPWLVSQLGR
jgi:hypothetical protein